jgi:hypothetical protein
MIDYMEALDGVHMHATAVERLATILLLKDLSYSNDFLPSK